jgi:hypothetical protein
MKKFTHTLLTASLVVSPIAAQAVTITWNDNTAPLDTFPGTATYLGGAPGYTTGFSAGNEFRIIDAGGSGPANGEKSSISGGEQWVFDDGTGVMTNVIDTAMTPGASGGAAPGGAAGIMQNAPFFTIPFGFVAPTLGSAAGDLYGEAVLSSTTSGFDILFPVLEAQWGSSWFTLGSSTDGITFNCDVLGLDVACTAEHQIAASEDPTSAGFAGFVPQWELHGTVSAVPVPAAVWLFGSGLVGLIGVARRKQLHV